MTLTGFKRRIAFFFVNKIFEGVHPNFWGMKRGLLNWAGMKIGAGTKIVGPVKIDGTITVGEDTWIGRGLEIHGNGSVVIGSNCDIAPNVTFLTGSHLLGSAERRAGSGINFNITINDGTWIGAKSTIVGNTEVGKGCIIGACSMVNKSCIDNVLVAGIPAKIVKQLHVN